MNELTFEQKVRIALIHKNMTASGLAKELEITDSYLSDILKDKRPAPKVREQICEFLGIEHE